MKAQQKQKEAYDKKHSCPELYKLGTIVLKKGKEAMVLQQMLKFIVGLVVHDLDYKYYASIII